MALELQTTLDNDAVGNYWKIISIADSRKQHRADLTIGLFTSAASKDKEPLKIYGYSFGIGGDAAYPYSIQALEGTNHVALAYTTLKTLSEFSGAIDV